MKISVTEKKNAIMAKINEIGIEGIRRYVNEGNDKIIADGTFVNDTVKEVFGEWTTAGYVLIRSYMADYLLDKLSADEEKKEE